MILSKRLQQREKDVPFAFFDFDGTLTTKDSFMPFLKYCVGSTQYYLKLIPILPILVGYLVGWIKNDRAKEIVLTHYLKGWSLATLETQSQGFNNEILPSMLLEEGLNALKHYQKQGYYCVLVSASPELYLKYWVEKYGFDGLIGTQLAFDNGILTGKLQGKNCFGEEKVKRIEAEFGIECWKNSVAYSDSKVDLPMLIQAEQGFLLVNQQFQKIGE